MNGLRASNFRRIDKGLLFDIVLMIVCPVLIILCGQFLNEQMIAEGYSASEITLSSVTQYSSPITKLIYVIEIFEYCGPALCYILVMSGLDEVLKLSVSYKYSRRGFLTLILVNAVALTVRMVSLLGGEGESYAWFDSMYVFAGFLLKTVLGVSLFLLLRGNMDVLHSIGEDVAAYRTRTLSICVVISFPLLGIFMLADHFAPEMPFGADFVFFFFNAVVWIWAFIGYFRAYLCARKVTGIVSVISEEVVK